MDERRGPLILVYSPLWSLAEALAGLCRSDEKDKTDGVNQARVIQVLSREMLLCELAQTQPDILVLDIILRENGDLLNTIRCIYPGMPVIITQSRFLFSDRVVSEYFGCIWLKEYDALLASYPFLLLQDHLTEPLLSGTECGGYVARQGRENIPDTDMLKNYLRALLSRRLYQLCGSPRLCEVGLDWLAKGVSPLEVSRGLGRSTKLIYHYRWQLARLLHIHRVSLDFIPSLTIGSDSNKNESISCGINYQSGEVCPVAQRKGNGHLFSSVS